MFVVSICEKCARNILELVVFPAHPFLKQHVCTHGLIYQLFTEAAGAALLSLHPQQEGALEKAVVGGNNLEW